MDKFIEALLDSIVSDIISGSKTTEEKPEEEVKTPKDMELDEKEFKSLVTDEEREAVEEVVKAVKHLKEVHQQSLVDKLGVSADAKQSVHFVVFSEIVKDICGNAVMLSEIDTRGVKALEEVHKECGRTYSEILKAKCLESIFRS